MFKDITSSIEAKEIVGSYCPGDYDLSIDDKKFAGISQRRIRNGVAVQIYLCVNGSGSNRASIVRDFYELALNGENTRTTYPSINPMTMASLSELLNTNFTIQDVMVRLLKSLNSLADVITPSSLNGNEIDLYQHHLQRMIDRNEKIQALIDQE
jgi:octanoyl-[GcvH]:protein N-octanoyltransferase